MTAALLDGTQNRGMVALLGVLTAIVGVLLIRHPIAGVVAVALLIGIWLITIGVIRFVAAFEVAEYRGWNIVAGLIEVIAGAVIVSIQISASRPSPCSSASLSSSTVRACSRSGGTCGP